MRRKADLRSKSPEPMASVYKENEMMGLLGGDYRTPPSQFVPGSVSSGTGKFIIPTFPAAAFPTPSSSHLNCQQAQPHP